MFSDLDWPLKASCGFVSISINHHWCVCVYVFMCTSNLMLYVYLRWIFPPNFKSIRHSVIIDRPSTKKQASYDSWFSTYDVLNDFDHLTWLTVADQNTQIQPFTLNLCPQVCCTTFVPLRWRLSVFLDSHFHYFGKDTYFVIQVLDLRPLKTVPTKFWVNIEQHRCGYWLKSTDKALKCGHEKEWGSAIYG